MAIAPGWGLASAPALDTVTVVEKVLPASTWVGCTTSSIKQAVLRTAIVSKIANCPYLCVDFFILFNFILLANIDITDSYYYLLDVI
jgi:hypothetical protein